MLEIDREIRLEHMRPEFVRQLFEAVEKLEPTGSGIPKRYSAAGTCAWQARGRSEMRRHLKGLQAGRNSMRDCVQAGLLDAALPERIDIAYTFEMNSYRAGTHSS